MSGDNDKSELSVLLASIRRGDRHTFNTVYSKYYSGIATYLLNYTADKDSIDDVVQDTFLTLWDTRKKLNIKTSLKGYLYKVAYNKLMQTFKKSSRRNKMLMSYYNSAITPIIYMDKDDSYITERLKKLNQCIELLPKRCKQVFIAKKISGLKHSAIAEELGISVKTIEGHITKAYILIKKCVGS